MDEPIDPATEAGAETGSDAADGPVNDGATEAAASDAEAGTDGGVLFTDNFDKGDAGRSPQWTNFFNPAGKDAGDILVEPPGLSLPNAFHVDNRDSPFFGGLEWRWPTAASKTRFSMSLDVNVVAYPTSNAVIVENVVDGMSPHNFDGSPAPVLAISPHPTDAAKARFYAFNLLPMDTAGIGQYLADATLDTWVHVEMTYEPVAGAPGQWRLTWSVGSPPAVFTKDVAAPSTIAEARTTFIGVKTGNGNTNVRFDNVKIDLR